jgi:putative hemolysin
MVLTLALVPAAVAAADESSAEEYCTQQGGAVVGLKPYLNAGSDSQMELGGSLQVCQFTQQDGDNITQTVVDLTTLHSEKPTLAALAYIAAVPSSNSGAAGSNPASSYCPDDLGGTEQFGTTGSGAWVGELDPGMEAGDAEPLSDVINLCVFADRSAIDDFGLFYHAGGEVRGVDLTTVMRYQANEGTPDIYGS